MMNSHTYPMTEVDWDILEQLDKGVLRWSPDVGECWRNLVNHEYVQPNFGKITELGRNAVLERREILRQKSIARSSHRTGSSND